MKKILSLLLAVYMAFGSVACAMAQDVATPVDIPAAPESTQPPQEATAVPEWTPAPENTQDPSPTADVTPEAESTLEPTQTPTGSEEPEASPEASAEPEETEVPEETSVPGEAAEPTEEPAAEVEADATATPSAEPTPALPAADYGSGPMYVLDNGFKHYGDMAELMPLGQVLYLYHTDVVPLENIAIEEASTLSYALDPEVFAQGKWTIYLSVRDPDGVVKENTIFLWVGEKETAAPSDRLDEIIDAEDEDVLEWELQAIPADYVPGEPCRPTFTLMALPDLTEGMGYAVIIDGGEPKVLDGNTYAPEHSGEYRFAVLDASGKVVGRSAKYSVTLAEITPEPTQAPTPEPTAEPTAEPTEVPAEEPAPEPTAEPMAEPTPTAEPTVVPFLPMDDLTANMDAFVSANAGSSAESGVIAWAVVDGETISGSLAELLASSCDTIYIATRKTIILEGDITALSGKTLLPDPDVFGEDYVVTVTNSSNSIELADALFVSVVYKTNAEETSAVLTVTAEGFTSGKWTNRLPVFQLSSEPDLPATTGGYSYAVSVDGGAAIHLAEAAYAAVEEGEYTLQFSVADPDGTAVALSDVYTVRLDVAAPLMQVSTSRDGTMMVVAGDLGSGAASCSVDGGATWQMLSDQGEGVASYTTTISTTTEFAPGMIIVQDRAGNRTSNEETITVTVQTMGGYGGYRRSSGRATSHAASTEEAVTAYNGVELILDDGSMSQLVVGDEMLDMVLVWDNAREEDEDPKFTAAFTTFEGSDADVDTLVLTASGVTAETAAEYTWHFSGQVYKKLAASGIDYLVLRSGDHATVLSTAGFSAGIRYSMYRAEGLPSKDFAYTLRMGLEDNAIELDVTVSGVTWRMSDDPSSEFYYYDVITGPVDMFDMLKG